eukprot:761212-Hanusia_phi.AAC.3
MATLEGALALVSGLTRYGMEQRWSLVLTSLCSCPPSLCLHRCDETMGCPGRWDSQPGAIIDPVLL